MRRGARATVVMLVVIPALAILGLLVSCSPEAATGSAELGSPADSEPEPTIDFGQPDPEVGVVIVPTPTPEGPRPFQIVTLLGETGVLAPLDGPAVAGVVAEVERLNRDGGVLGRELELRRFDTNSRASLTERTMSRLVENPPDLVIVSCDTEFSQPALEIADAAGLLTISPCADDPRYLTGAFGLRNFTLGAPEAGRGAILAQVALDTYGPTAMVLRDVTSPEALAFCDGFERAFREAGGSVLYRDEFSYDTLEPVEDRLTELGRSSAFIAVCSHVPGGEDAAPNIINMLRRIEFTAPIVAGSSVDESGWFSLVPELGELLFISWSSTFGNDPDDRINELVRRVQQNGETPGGGVSTILGAEAVEAWARAVEATGDGDFEGVVAELSSFRDEPFSTGDITFTSGARMDIGRTYRILAVRDGELRVVGLESVSDGG